MSVTEWIAIGTATGGTAVVIVGGLIHIVRLLQKLVTGFESHVGSNKEAHDALWEKVGEHGEKLEEHGKDIAVLKA